MNYLMFQQSGDGQCLKVPDGLKELMSDISREVLRDQPENIYEFIADYLEELVITREHRGVAENILNMVIDESVTIFEMFQESGLSLEHAKKCAKIVESSFNDYTQKKNKKKLDDEEKSSKIVERDVCRKIIKSCNLSPEEDLKLRKIVQTCFKNFYFREKSYKTKLTRIPDFNWGKRAEKTLDIYRRTAPEKNELENAAVVIQSAYRSYFVRKVPKEMQRFNDCATKIQTRFRAYRAQKELEKATAAVIKIQALYRGYRVRKALLNRIGSVQSIQQRSSFMGVIRSFVNNMVGLKYMPNEEPFLFMSQIVDKVVNDSMSNEMKEAAVHDLIQDVAHSSMKNVVFGGDTNEAEDMAARTIQKVYRGFQERKKLSTKITSVCNILQQSPGITPDIRIIEQEIVNVIESMQDAIEFE